MRAIRIDQLLFGLKQEINADFNCLFVGTSFLIGRYQIKVSSD